jgi:hypothetical protein
MAKNGDLLYEKSMSQIEAFMPPELKNPMKDAITTCKDIRKLCVCISNVYKIYLYVVLSYNYSI